ncbi:hypothetical protein GCM10010349_74230 [Streptomyces flavofungini]|nr:hypothetical protein GCM10010349_74230 [Streptomyces flavofungini]
MEGEAGAEDAEDDDGEDAGEGRRRLRVRARGQAERGQAGGGEELGGGQGQRRRAAADEVPGHVREGDGVADGGGEQRERAPAREPRLLPRREDQQRAAEAEDESGEPLRAEPPLRTEQQAEPERPQRGRGVHDARDTRVDRLLADAEEQERQRVAEQGRHDEMAPDAALARQPLAGRAGEDEEDGGAERAAHDRHVQRREAARQGQLDPQETRTPEQGEDGDSHVSTVPRPYS